MSYDKVGAVRRLVDFAEEFPELSTGALEMIATIIKPAPRMPVETPTDFSAEEFNGLLPPPPMPRRSNRKAKRLAPQGKLANHPDTPAKEWYSVAEYAKATGRSVAAINRRIRNCHIYAERDPEGFGGAWRISALEVARFEKHGPLLPKEMAS